MQISKSRVWLKLFITCPANQRSSNNTPRFTDRWRWGTSRGRRHRYQRKYCEKTKDSSHFYSKQHLRESCSTFSGLHPCRLSYVLSSIFILHTCDVQTLLKETKMAVCRKQQKARSAWKAQEATSSRRSCGRNAARPKHQLHLLSAPTGEDLLTLNTAQTLTFDFCSGWIPALR